MLKLNCKTISILTAAWGCWGRLGEANVSCTLRHRGVQLILVYSLARPVILAANRGEGECFLFLLFLHFHSFSFLPCPSLSSHLLSLLSLFSLSVGDDTMTHKGWRVVKPQLNQSIHELVTRPLCKELQVNYPNCYISTYQFVNTV